MVTSVFYFIFLIDRGFFPIEEETWKFFESTPKYSTEYSILNKNVTVVWSAGLHWESRLALGVSPCTPQKTETNGALLKKDYIVFPSYFQICEMPFQFFKECFLFFCIGFSVQQDRFRDQRHAKMP